MIETDIRTETIRGISLSVHGSKATGRKLKARFPQKKKGKRKRKARAATGDGQMVSLSNRLTFTSDRHWYVIIITAFMNRLSKLVFALIINLMQVVCARQFPGRRDQ